MFIFGNFLNAFAKVLDMALNFFMWVIIIRALITWVNPDPYNPIVQFLTRVTEPILSPIRRLLPTYRIGVDLSPFIAILIIYFMRD
ncbi:MAG: YggT family protein, partial [Nitrospirota bacterium]